MNSSTISGSKLKFSESWWKGYEMGELSNRLSASDFVPELIVDALFGMHIAFEELRTDDQATAFEMIAWANRSNIDILSVDVPSGISAASGELLLAHSF
jgi:enhancer of mRNA-decapping protein 3